jgi:polysaccharide biosynthesis/export protein
VLGLAALGALGGCAAERTGWMPTGGPGLAAFAQPRTPTGPALTVVDLREPRVRRLEAVATPSLARSLTPGPSGADRIGPGDAVAVTLWEAPPAVLWGAPSESAAGGVPAVAHPTALPAQPVSADGAITVPFAGRVPVVGLTPAEVERVIVERLRPKAHAPEAVVTLESRVAATVTVVGAVNQTTRLGLTAKGERLLDALAAAGGPKAPLEKSTVQVTRGSEVVAVPLQNVVRDPTENIPLIAGDVVAVYYQPASFIALGALTRNDEVQFEATGISIAQALGRVNGLIDQRATPRGVFLFRQERAAAVAALGLSAPADADGSVPVVYTLDLTDPASVLAAQHFAMRDHDVLYVANAPTAELQKFLSLIATAAYSFTNFGLKP